MTGGTEGVWCFSGVRNVLKLIVPTSGSDRCVTEYAGIVCIKQINICGMGSIE